MTFLRRILGIFVMIAGIIGLLLSLAGLTGIYLVKPVLTSSLTTIVDNISTSVNASQSAMIITDDALSAAITSVDALSEMLGTTAITVEDTQPVITQVTGLMSDTLPTTLQAATDSLVAAESAAQSLEGVIASFESFRDIVRAIPGIGSLVPASTTSYSPEKPLSQALGELSESIKDIPAKFEDMSSSLEKSDDNLGLIKSNLEVMSENVALIADSLSQYQKMIGESNSSMENLTGVLSSLQSNLGQIINIATLVLVLFFLWLLAAQVVVFSQGWELYRGTADRMSTGVSQDEPVDVAPAN